ncbi:MAG: hypothetical protein RL367_2216 [Pseudomonadota bacterium]
MDVSTPNAPNEALTSEFRSSLTSLIGPVAAGQRLGVAFSGGPDSLALLLLCRAAFPGQTRAATVDHGLRPDSRQEARHCAAVCQTLGVAHHILVPATAITGSLQAAARAVRYHLLGEWADANRIAPVMTGHHADDQAETMAMRLNRGSGLAGLGSIRAVNGRIARPLLGWRRPVLAQVARDSGLAVISDPSNQNDRFDRVRIRQALAQADWLDVAAWGQSAAALAQAETALAWAVTQAAASRLSHSGDAIILTDPAALPAEIRRRLVLLALAGLDPAAAPSGPETARFIATLMAGGKASIGHSVGENRDGSLVFRLAPPRSPRRATRSP